MEAGIFLFTLLCTACTAKARSQLDPEISTWWSSSDEALCFLKTEYVCVYINSTKQLCDQATGTRKTNELVKPRSKSLSIGVSPIRKLNLGESAARRGAPFSAAAIDAITRGRQG